MMKTLIPALICLFLAISCQAEIIYIDDDVGGDDRSSKNFTAFSYSISGYVKDGGLYDPGIENVEVSITGDWNGSVTTDANGYYIKTGLTNGNYTVAASKTGYTFEPSSYNVTIDGANVANKNFYTYSISGRVMGAGPISGVTVTITGQGSVTTDVNGYYEKRNLASGTYTVEASSSVYVFDPACHVVELNWTEGNADNRNFTAFLPPQANFTTNPYPAVGVAPLTVSFTNTSTGDIVLHEWDFGDGNTSTVRDPPPHTYNTHGIYTVTLTVTGPSAIPEELRTSIKTKDIQVLARPIAHAGPDQLVNEGSLVTLDGSASYDPDGVIASYFWEQIAGPTVMLSDPSAVNPTFTAPDVSGQTPETVTFRLAVTDYSGLGNSNTDTNTTIITINQPPVADARSDQLVDEGDLVMLDGSASSDPDGTVESYFWEQIGGLSVTLPDPYAVNPTFMAPSGTVGPAPVIVIFQLTVTDNSGFQNSGADPNSTVGITINRHPVADVGAAQIVNEGDIVTLDGSGSNDPDGDDISYFWVQTLGPPVSLSDHNAVNPTFKGPEVVTDMNMAFQLTVTDTRCLQDSNSVTITVINFWNRLYVDTDASGNNDGSSWADAYNYLEDALAEAYSIEKPAEIRVAEGIYKPHEPTVTFQLLNGVTIKGGYAGFAEPDPYSRDIGKYETILRRGGYHVVTGSGTDANAILDGFTITGGNAIGSYPDPESLGGGMYNESGHPTLINCTFRQNSAESVGGGMANVNGSKPAVTNCIFIGNVAAFGGGMFNDTNSNPEVSNCIFTGNDAWLGYGGGMYNRQSRAMVTNCIFWGDTATNGPEIAVMGSESTITVLYTDIQGGQTQIYLGGTLNWGPGNIDIDPSLADPARDDYHLKSEAGRWDPDNQTWVTDASTSPCIDAGNPGCPLRDEPADANNVRINMGAYGGTAEASMPPYDWALLADITNDGTVDSNDLAAFVDYWLYNEECVPSDLNRDQYVDMFDFALFGQDWCLETIWHE